MTQEIGYRLREAVAEDAPFMAALRNASEVRAASRRQHRLDPGELRRELLAAIADPRRSVLVIEANAEKAGYVRLDPRDGGELELSIALDRSWRGKGLGTRAIRETVWRTLEDRPSATLVALIRRGNDASARAFTAAGFVLEGTDGELQRFRNRRWKRSPGRVAAIVQARAGSTRLPRKVLAEINGRPLLTWLLVRLGRSETVHTVAVAASTAQSDDELEALVASTGVAVVRGPLHDVLERYRLAVEAVGADTVVRITGDCPFVDPEIVDLVVARFAETATAYVSNVHPPTFPDGLDVEVIARDALQAAASEAVELSDREHVTRYLVERPGRFPSANVTRRDDLSSLRLTVDYPDDLEFARAVFARFQGREASFSHTDVLNELQADPRLRALMPPHRRNEGSQIPPQAEGCCGAILA